MDTGQFVVGGADLSIQALMEYLKNSHSYFLDFCLPAIRRKLIEAIDCSQDGVAILILKFYDEYVNEVRRHMEYEDNMVFGYVSSYSRGRRILIIIYWYLPESIIRYRRNLPN